MVYARVKESIAMMSNDVRRTGDLPLLCFTSITAGIGDAIALCLTHSLSLDPLIHIEDLISTEIHMPLIPQIHCVGNASDVLTADHPTEGWGGRPPIYVPHSVRHRVLIVRPRVRIHLISIEAQRAREQRAERANRAGRHFKRKVHRNIAGL